MLMNIHKQYKILNLINKLRKFLTKEGYIAKPSTKGTYQKSSSKGHFTY